MTQTTIYPVRTLLESNSFASWFPAADADEIEARKSDPDALIDYLSKANDLTPTEVLEILNVLCLTKAPLVETTALRAA